MKKKALSLALSLALCMGAATPAFADDVEYAEWVRTYAGQQTENNWTYDLLEDGSAVLKLSTVDSTVAPDKVLTLPAALGGHSVTTVGSSAFDGASPMITRYSYDTLVIPEGYTALEVQAFAHNSGLQKVTLPSTLKEIGPSCFRDTGLTDLDIPASVTTLSGGDILTDCMSLENVTVRNPELDITRLSLSERNFALKSVTCAPGSKAEAYALEHGYEVRYLDGAGPMAGAGFTDVVSDAYYYQPVIWAVEQGITKGTGDGTTFSPDIDCTRGQILTFLWRAAGSPDYSGNVKLLPFTDVKEGDYFAEAVAWAYSTDVFRVGSAGVTETGFFPDEPCTRATSVQFMWGARGRHDLTAMEGVASFTDVAEDSEYFKAVIWAAASNVTKGTGDGTTFSPDMTCTRGQIVTFLQRLFDQ